MAVNINGVNKLVFNKLDVLEEVGEWRVYEGINMFEFTSSEDMQFWIREMLDDDTMDIVFSGNKDRI